MSAIDIGDTTVPLRILAVNTRVPDQVTDILDGTDNLLLETMLGRYVLDRDGRTAWVLIDGVRTVTDIAQAISATTGQPLDNVRAPLRDFLLELATLGLIETT